MTFKILKTILILITLASNAFAQDFHIAKSKELGCDRGAKFSAKIAFNIENATRQLIEETNRNSKERREGSEKITQLINKIKDDYYFKNKEMMEYYDKKQAQDNAPYALYLAERTMYELVNTYSELAIGLAFNNAMSNGSKGISWSESTYERNTSLECLNSKSK